MNRSDVIGFAMWFTVGLCLFATGLLVDPYIGKYIGVIGFGLMGSAVVTTIGTYRRNGGASA